MALYRKYRPATFAEVVGQEHVTEPLSTALDSGRINHAYLFSGPRGCGKTSSARILARSLNCAAGPTSTPCGVCASCIALAPGGPGNLDVTEMDAASHGGVDDARELRDRAFYAPAESRYRVFIIDEAHMVTPQGFNALLKIVEEPPEHLIFIFATTEPEKVLTTIRSRTHHYPFRLLAPAVMRPLLERICTAESVQVEPAVYPLVIRAGGGSPRDSLSVMDQLLAGAGPEGVTYQRALGLLGVTDAALIDAAVDALAQADGAALFGAVERVMDAGHDPRRFSMDLLERLRDLILLGTVPDAADRGLIDVPADVLDQMRGEASRLGLATLTRCAEVTHAALAEMRGAISPRLLLEVMCARMLLPGADDSHAALLQRVEALEQRPAARRAVGDSAAAESADAPVPAGAAESSRFVRPSRRAADEPVPSDAPAQAPAPVAPAVSAPSSPAAELPTNRPATPERAQPTPAGDPLPASERRSAPAASPPTIPADAREFPVPPAAQSAHPAVEPAHPTPDRELPTPERLQSTPDPTRPLPSRPVQRGLRADKPSAPPAGPAAPEVAAATTVEQVRAAWPKVLRAVNTRSRVLGTLMANVQVSAISGEMLHVAVVNPALRGRFHDPQHAQTLRDAVREVFGAGWDVVVGDDAAHAPAPTARAGEAARKAPPTFERRSRGDQQRRPEPTRRQDQADREPVDRSPRRAPAAPSHDDIPLPPEPDPYPAEDVSEEEMMAAAAAEDAVAQSDPSRAPVRRDPDEMALELLRTELGARPID